MCEYSPAKKVVNASVSVVQESPVGLIGLDLWAILRWPSNLDGLIHRQAVCCLRERDCLPEREKDRTATVPFRAVFDHDFFNQSSCQTPVENRLFFTSVKIFVLRQVLMALSAFLKWSLYLMKGWNNRPNAWTKSTFRHRWWLMHKLDQFKCEHNSHAHQSYSMAFPKEKHSIHVGKQSDPYLKRLIGRNWNFDQ